MTNLCPGSNSGTGDCGVCGRRDAAHRLHRAPSPKPKISDELDTTLEHLLKKTDFLPEVERRMRASLSEPGGHGFEVKSRPSVLYCEAHERDLRECEDSARRKGVAFACVGVPVPTVSDPTGDGAMHDEQIRDEVRRFEREARAVISASSWISGFVERWMRDDRTPLRDPYEKSKLPNCEIHARYGYVRTARSQGTRVKDHGKPILDVPYALCEWCEDTVRRLQRLPLEVEVHDHVDGKRLRMVREDETYTEERRRDRDAKLPFSGPDGVAS